MDQQILNAIGLSEDDTADLIRKHQAYLDSLNPAQRAVVARAMPSWDEAAAAVGPGCTADDLNKFVSSRGRTANTSSALAVPMPVDRGDAEK
jgi:hypothetical protein